MCGKNGANGWMIFWSGIYGGEFEEPFKSGASVKRG